MAVYTHNEIANPNTLEWILLDAQITTISAGEVVLTNTDGTLTILTGSGFSGTTGPAGSLTAGSITAIARTDAARTVTYETLTGFTYAATSFSTRLTTEADLQGVAADILIGDDTLNGFSGNDFFKGFAGNDTINGGGGIDTVRYSGPFHSGAIAVTLSAVSTITGNATAGTDTLNSVEAVVGSNSAAGDDFTATAAFNGSFGTFNSFEGRGGNDRITGNGNTQLSFNEATAAVTVNLVAGTAVGDASVGSDTFTGVNNVLGSQFADTLIGNGLDNIFIGQGGADSMTGNAGTDYASYQTASSGVTADLGNAANNTGEAVGDSYTTIEGLIGSAQGDNLRGNGAANILFGEGGNDFLMGRAGNDTLNGGEGSDFADYAGSTIGVQVSLANPAVNTGDALGDTFISIESIRGSIHNDTLIGDGENNLLRGGLGGDSLDGGAGIDLADYGGSAAGLLVSLANPGANTGEAIGDTYTGIEGIRGSGLNDTLIGDGANNFLRGGGGADSLDGGAGRDFADYRNSNTPLLVNLANPGANTGEALGDTYTSIEHLVGSSFNDTLVGDSEDNLLRGGLGVDQLDGGTGTDFADYRGSDTGMFVSLANTALNTGEAVGDIYIALEGIGGSEFNDTLIGDGGNNFLRGYGGGDSLDGGAGNDWADYRSAAAGLTVNLGNAAANTGEAIGDSYTLIESIQGSEFGDTLIGDGGNNFLRGRGGADVLNGGSGGSDWADYRDARAAVLASLAAPGSNTGIAAGDSYISIENLRGDTLNDTLIGDGGNNQLDGGPGGNDSLDGGAGVDTMTGGIGDDTYIADNAGDIVNEAAGEGNDTIFSSANLIMGNNVETMFLVEGSSATDGITHAGGAGIVGNSNVNNLTGSTGNDVLLGLGGNDRIDGGIGTDNMSGGLGDDTFYVDNEGDLTSELAGEGNDIAFSSINFVLGANVETLYLVEGSAATDGNTHNAGAGIVGNSNNNNLTGGTGNDVLLGQGGNDRIEGGVGIDNMSGGVGDDTFYVENEGDLTSELAGEGNDTAFSTINFVLGANVETLYLVEGSAATDGITHAAGAGIVGNSNNNNLTGNIGNDVLLGLGGNDRIDGGIGADNMSGGIGDDTFYVDNEADLVSELAGEGNDTAFSSINFVLGANVETLYLVEGSAATDGLSNDQGSGIIGNSNNNNLTGKGGVDVFLGGAGGDRLEGGANNDNLNGESGGDRIIGGTGSDNLTGGSGNDFFIYTNINEAGDTVTDFTTAAGADQDVLDLRTMWSTFSGTAGIADAAGAVASGHLTFTQSGTSTQVFADATGGVHNPGEQILLATVNNTTAAAVQGLTIIL